jgi:hypothetical protein
MSKPVDDLWEFIKMNTSMKFNLTMIFGLSFLFGWSPFLKLLMPEIESHIRYKINFYVLILLAFSLLIIMMIDSTRRFKEKDNKIKLLEYKVSKFKPMFAKLEKDALNREIKLAEEQFVIEMKSIGENPTNRELYLFFETRIRPLINFSASNNIPVFYVKLFNMYIKSGKFKDFFIQRDIKSVNDKFINENPGLAID